MIGQEQLKITADRIGLAGSLQFSAVDARQWGSVFAGLSFVTINNNGMPKHDTALTVGAHGGFDVANFGRHHVTVYGRVDGDIGSDTSFAAFTFGLGYRHR
jgi:hypothetical protein